ncbi:uncharacterized protein [Montipora capricornis]|uniref:uncharacterized protein n=1 Tax=Montipora capricornis TaxID=246305 RepID=UPI0035F191F0
MEGRSYNRAVRFHKLSYEAFRRVAWAGFLQWVESRHPQDAALINKALEDIGSLADNLQKSTLDHVFISQAFQVLFERSEEYMEHLRKTNGPLSAFWLSYIDMVELMLHMIRASREGNWMLHLACIRQMLPWCFAYDNTNYARYMSIYYSDMTSLPKEHPQVHAFMEAGGFSVQMSPDNAFGRIPVDQTIEETINKDTQTAGGTRGFSLKPGALQRYYMTAEFRAMFLREMREMVGYAQDNNGHADLQKSRIKKDEKDVQEMTDLLFNSWLNPFSDESQPLASISTSAVPSPDIALDLAKAYLSGEAAYQDFKNNRLEPEEPLVKFHEHPQEAEIEDIQQYVESKDNKKEQGRRNGHSCRPQSICEDDNNSRKSSIAHASSLATSNGLPRKTNKAQLGRELEKLVQPTAEIPSPSVYVIDGMALVQKLKVSDQMTFRGTVCPA